jgi:hypothetical protein
VTTEGRKTPNIHFQPTWSKFYLADVLSFISLTTRKVNILISYLFATYSCYFEEYLLYSFHALGGGADVYNFPIDLMFSKEKNLKTLLCLL